MPEVCELPDRRRSSEDLQRLANTMASLLRESTSNTRWRSTIRPPTFGGAPDECPRMFIERLEKLIEGLEDAEKITATVDQFRHDAQTWSARYTGLRSHEEFKNRFLEKFDGLDIKSMCNNC